MLLTAGVGGHGVNWSFIKSTKGFVVGYICSGSQMSSDRIE